MPSALLRGCVIALVLFALGGGVAYIVGAWPFAGTLRQSAESQGEALIGGPFRLVDQDGERVSEATFGERARLMYFGYSYCPDVCPVDLAKMTAAYGRLSAEERSRVVPIFVTVDPERDTVEKLADYVDLFHPDLVGLTGTIDEIEAVARAFRVYYRKAESDQATDYLVDHSSFTYLMDQENSYVTHFGHDSTAEEIAEGVRRHLEAAPAPVS